MSNLLKVELTLFVVCAIVGILGGIHVNGYYAGLAASDDEAFAVYVSFAKPMQHEVHSARSTVWAAIDKH